MMIGREMRTLQVCDSDTTYWLDLPETVFAHADALNRAPYQPLYGEVWGYFEPATSGFAKEYGTKFVVTDFNIITAENPNRCAQTDYTAKSFGNDPSWSATLKNDELTLLRSGIRALNLAVTDTESSSTKTRYQLETGELTLNKQLCHDTMSESIYSWNAQLNANGEQYSGCYTDGNISTNKMTGRYSQKLDPQTTMQLTLGEDYQSETRYLYSDDSTDVVESGFWQPLNSGLIQVTTTSYQGQRLIAVREFESKGGSLSTDHETINGATYPLTSGGLLLKKLE
jgi:putative lipoprotein